MASTATIQTEVRQAGEEGPAKARAAIKDLFSADPVMLFLVDGNPAAALPLGDAILDMSLMEAAPAVYELAGYGCAAWVKPGKRGPAGLLRWALPALQRCAPLRAALRWAAPSAGPLLDYLAAVAPDRSGTAVQVLVDTLEVMNDFLKEMGVASCMHLQYIGTAAGMQGRGLGGQMMRHLCKLADEGGQFFFLEASSPSSRALYARYGFADYKQIVLSGDDGTEGPTIYCMARAPVAKAAPTAT